MMITLYGIKNCNTVQKAVKLLEEKGIAYTFHDFKKNGITQTELSKWEKALGWEVLVNKKGTTWRNLTEAEKSAIVDGPSAIAALEQHTSMIKRPVIVKNGKVLAVGYDENILTNL